MKHDAAISGFESLCGMERVIRTGELPKGITRHFARRLGSMIPSWGRVGLGPSSQHGSRVQPQHLRAPSQCLAEQPICGDSSRKGPPHKRPGMPGSGKGSELRTVRTTPRAALTCTSSSCNWMTLATSRPMIALQASMPVTYAFSCDHEP